MKRLLMLGGLAAAMIILSLALNYAGGAADIPQTGTENIKYIKNIWVETDETDEKDEPDEIIPGLTKTHDEKHDRYNFAYKRSALSIRKEIFDEYNLTNEHIHKFFEAAETAYDKLSEFFSGYRAIDDSVQGIPGYFSYHAVPGQFSDPDLYDDYSDKLIFNGWADVWLNAGFYEENMFAAHLSAIEAGFPRAAARGLGYIFTKQPSEGPEEQRGLFVNHHPLMWDEALFPEIAVFYLASEMKIADYPYIDTATLREYTYESPNFYWNKFFGLAEKYGYDTISDTFKAMIIFMENNDIFENTKSISEENEIKSELFKQILSEITGDDIDAYYANGGYITMRNIYFGNNYLDTAYNGSISMSSHDFADSDIEPLEQMTNLTGLSLADNQISDISPLAELRDLTVLNLSDNQISDISALTGLVNLTYLLLESNQISNVDALAELTDLKQLYLGRNQITDISALGKLTNLTTLVLYGNQISDVSALSGLTNLTDLFLTNNPLSAGQIAELMEALPDTEIYSDWN